MNRFYKLCRKQGFDVEKYNRVKDAFYELEQDLDRLRRSSGLSARAPQLEQTITIVRDVKSTAQATGSRSTPDLATSLDPANIKKA